MVSSDRRKLGFHPHAALKEVVAYRRVDRAFAQVAIRRWYNYIPVGLQVDCQLIFSLQDHIDQSHFAKDDMSM